MIVNVGNLLEIIDELKEFFLSFAFSKIKLNSIIKFYRN